MSMYPLAEEYIPPIIEFIDSIKSPSKIEVRTNGMSTQLFGEYDDVMKLITESMKVAMTNEPRVVFVTKFLNTDVSDYRASS